MIASVFKEPPFSFVDAPELEHGSTKLVLIHEELLCDALLDSKSMIHWWVQCVYGEANVKVFKATLSQLASRPGKTHEEFVARGDVCRGNSPKTLWP